MSSSLGGSASVRIVPDLDGFGRTIQLALDSQDFDIDAEINEAMLAASIEAAEEVMPELDLGTDLDPTGALLGVEQIEGLLPDVELQATFGEAVRARLNAAIAGLSATLQPIRARLELITGPALAQLAAFEATTGRALRGLGTAAVFGGAAGLGGVGLAAGIGVQQLAQFDDALNESLAIVADVTPEIREQFADTAEEVARTTRFGADQAAEAFFFLASAGLDATQQLEALPVLAEGAQAGAFELATAVDLFTDSASAVGLAVTDAEDGLTNLIRTQDVFVKANLLANASVEQFATAITNRAGAQLRALNKDLEEGVAVLAAFGDQGVKGRRAGEQLNIVLRDTATFAQRNADEFAALGIEVFDAEGNFRNIADVVAEFEDALGPMSAEARAAAFAQLGLSQQSADSITTLLGTSDAIREYEAALRDAGGTAAEVAENQLGSLPAILDLIGGNFEVAALALGEPFRAAIQDIFENNREGFEGFFAGVEDRASVFGERIVGFLEGAFAFFASQEFANFMSSVAEGFGILGDAIQGFAAGFAAGFGGAEEEGQSFVETIGDAFVALADIAEDVLPVVGEVLGTIVGFLSDNREAVGAFLKAWLAVFAALKIGRILRPLIQAFTTLGGWIGNLLIRFGVLRSVLTFIGPIIAGITSPVLVAVGAFAALAAGVFLLWQNSETFRETVMQLWEVLQEVGAFVGEQLMIHFNAFRAGLELAWMAVQAMWEQMRPTFERMRDFIMEVVDFVTALITGDFDQAGKELVEIVTAFLDLVVDFFVKLPARLIEALVELSPAMLAKGEEAMDEFWQGMQDSWPDVLAWVVARGPAIVDAITVSPDEVFEAGFNFMMGFLDGLKDGWEEVKDFLNFEVTLSLPFEKGPPEVDKQILFPAGQLVMDGFLGGLRDRWEPVKSWLNDRGGLIASALTPAQVGGLQDVMGSILGGTFRGDVGESLTGIVPNVPRFWTSFGDMMNQATEIARMFNVAITSTLRSPEENARVGGAPGSFHLGGRAVDFGGTIPALDSLAAWARQMEQFFAEILWRVQGHFDHVHLAWNLLPRRQHGGGVRGGEPHLVGEAGAEIFFPETSGFVFSNADSRALIDMAKALRSGQLFGQAPQINVVSNNADAAVVAGMVDDRFRNATARLVRR